MLLLAVTVIADDGRQASGPTGATRPASSGQVGYPDGPGREAVATAVARQPDLLTWPREDRTDSLVEEDWQPVVELQQHGGGVFFYCKVPSSHRAEEKW